MGRPATGNKSYPLIVRLSPEVRSRAVELAAADDRSFNNWVSNLVKKAVEQSTEGKTAAPTIAPNPDDFVDPLRNAWWNLPGNLE